MQISTKKRMVLFVAVLLLLAGDVGSFFALRREHEDRHLRDKTDTMQIAPDERKVIPVRLFFFSESPSANRVLYYAYYPIHRLLGGDVQLLRRGGVAIEVNPDLTKTQGGFYLKDLDDINFAEDRPVDEGF